VARWWIAWHLQFGQRLALRIWGNVFCVMWLETHQQKDQDGNTCWLSVLYLHYYVPCFTHYQCTCFGLWADILLWRQSNVWQGNNIYIQKYEQQCFLHLMFHSRNIQHVSKHFQHQWMMQCLWSNSVQEEVSSSVTNLSRAIWKFASDICWWQMYKKHPVVHVITCRQQKYSSV